MSASDAGPARPSTPPQTAPSKRPREPSSSPGQQPNPSQRPRLHHQLPDKSKDDARVSNTIFGFPHKVWPDLSAQQKHLVLKHWLQTMPRVVYPDGADDPDLVVDWNDPTIDDLVSGMTWVEIAARIGLCTVDDFEAIQAKEEYSDISDLLEMFQSNYSGRDHYYNLCTHRAWNERHTMIHGVIIIFPQMSLEQTQPPLPQEFSSSRLRLPATPVKRKTESNPAVQDDVESDVLDNVKATPPMGLAKAGKLLNTEITKWDTAFQKVKGGWMPSSEFGLGDDQIVCFQLQDLGKKQDILDRAAEILSGDGYTLYINSSGSGKTTTMCHGFTTVYGFYASFTDSITHSLQPEQRHGHGSTDLSFLVEMLTSFSRWPKSNKTPKEHQACIEAVERMVGMLFLIRMKVLLHFLKHVPSDWTVEDCRREWLVIQAAPMLMANASDQYDIFHSLTACLRGQRAITAKACQTLTWQLYSQIYKLKRAKQLGFVRIRGSPFCLALDECNRAMDMYKGYFRSSDDPSIERSLISQMIKTIHLHFGMITNIASSGTGMSMHLAAEALSSSAGKNGALVPRSPCSVIEDKQSHRIWVKSGLNMLTPDKDILHDRLISRIVDWMGGRYRFSATFIELFHSRVRKGYTFKPSGYLHLLFNEYVRHITGGFVPNDAADVDFGLPELRSEDARLIQALHPIVNWVKFDQLQHSLPKLEDEFTSLTLRHILGSLTSVLDKEYSEVITTGIGYVKTTRPESLTAIGPIHLHEQIVLCAAVIRLNIEIARQWVKGIARNASSVELGYLQETQVFLLFMRHFGGQYQRLGDVLEVGDEKTWGPLADKHVTLVAVMKCGDGVYRSFSGSWTKAPAIPFACRAANSAEMKEVMETASGNLGIFPDTNFGPDLVCMLREKDSGSLTWVLCASKFSKGHEKGKGPVKPAVMSDSTVLSAINSIDPNKLYTRKDGGRVAPEVADTVKKVMERMLNAKCGDRAGTIPTAEPLPSEGTSQSTSTRVPKRFKFPNWLRVVALGPCATGDIFKKEAAKSRKVPLVKVSNKLMAQDYGDEWWHWALQNTTISPTAAVAWGKAQGGS